MVTDHLTDRGFDVFLPKIQGWVRRGHSRKRVERVLFPGYLFVRHDLDGATYGDVRHARGVVRVLGESWQKPCPIPAVEVESVRRVIASGEHVFGSRELQHGQVVRIVAGPLEGVEGTFVQSRAGRGMLLVSVRLLKRCVAVEIDESHVSAV